MSKIEKIVESSLKNLKERGILKSKEIESSKLANMLIGEFVDDLKPNELRSSFLNKYSTVRLVSMIKNLVEEEIKDDNVEMAFNIIIILNQRFEEDNSMKIEAEEVDKGLL